MGSTPPPRHLSLLAGAEPGRHALVVCPGPSAAGYFESDAWAQLAALGPVLIAVNGGARLFPAFDYWVAETYTSGRLPARVGAGRLIMRRIEGLAPRRIARQWGCRYVWDRIADGWENPSLGTPDARFNSGGVALSLAWILGCRTITVVGLDGGFRCARTGRLYAYDRETHLAVNSPRAHLHQGTLTQTFLDWLAACPRPLFLPPRYGGHIRCLMTGTPDCGIGCEIEASCCEDSA